MIQYHKNTGYQSLFQDKYTCPSCDCGKQPKVKNIMFVFDHSDGKIKQWEVPDILLNKIIDQTAKKKRNFIVKFFTWMFNCIRKLFKKDTEEKVIRFSYKNGTFKKLSKGE